MEIKKLPGGGLEFKGTITADLAFILNLLLETAECESVDGFDSDDDEGQENNLVNLELAGEHSHDNTDANHT